MRSLLKNRKFLPCLFVFVFTFVFFSSAPVVFADDIWIPDYYGWDNSAVAFWDYDDDIQNLALTDFWYYENLYPMYPEDPFYEFDPDTNWYRFFMPNFIDPLSEKYMRIQVTYFSDVGPDTPTIENIIGEDMEGGAYISEFISHVDWPADTPDAFYFYEDWAIYPNPDWEWIEISLAQGDVLYQVVIDTVSTPEPTTMLLVGVGLLGLASLRKRFRKD
ncbi:MAG: PEP-CTERM sorting domain-containing protein [Desulfobacteraceae bacterium]|jgi:hypothetical protein